MNILIYMHDESNLAWFLGRQCPQQGIKIIVDLLDKSTDFDVNVLDMFPIFLCSNCLQGKGRKAYFKNSPDIPLTGILKFYAFLRTKSS